GLCGLAQGIVRGRDRPAGAWFAENTGRFMKLYCVQPDITWENKRANFARVQSLLAEASPQPGSLVLLPEMFATGFSMNVARIREGRERETERFLAVTAKKLQVFLLGGVVNPAGYGKGANQAVVFSPKGKELSRYSKMQPFTPGGEADHYEA